MLPVVVGDLDASPATQQDEVCLAIDDAVQVAAQAFREARLAET